jgi:DNA-directed RNA polymerase alpha subunit
LELSVRAYNCLKRAGITRVGEILDKLAKGQSELLAIRNFGQKSFDELLDKLRDKGYIPAENSEPQPSVDTAASAEDVTEGEQGTEEAAG